MTSAKFGNLIGVRKSRHPPFGTRAMSLSKRVRIYTAEDVAGRKTSASCWLSRRGRVYDVTSFLSDHPGGDDLILKYGGQAVDNVMSDPGEHEHSDAAYEVMDGYVVGKLGCGENIVSEGAFLSSLSLSLITVWDGSDWEATDDFHPEDTNSAQDFEKNQFLDLSKPLLRQVWEANFR
jgi:4-hydroxysphinganine ceramide fatty acyl 2-hydroxylase